MKIKIESVKLRPKGKPFTFNAIGQSHSIIKDVNIEYDDTVNKQFTIDLTTKNSIAERSAILLKPFNPDIFTKPDTDYAVIYIDSDYVIENIRLAVYNEKYKGYNDSRYLGIDIHSLHLSSKLIDISEQIEKLYRESQDIKVVNVNIKYLHSNSTPDNPIIIEESLTIDKFIGPIINSTDRGVCDHIQVRSNIEFVDSECLTTRLSYNYSKICELKFFLPAKKIISSTGINLSYLGREFNVAEFKDIDTEDIRGSKKYPILEFSIPEMIEDYMD